MVTLLPMPSVSGEVRRLPAPTPVPAPRRTVPRPAAITPEQPGPATPRGAAQAPEAVTAKDDGPPGTEGPTRADGLASGSRDGLGEGPSDDGSSPRSVDASSQRLGDSPDRAAGDSIARPPSSPEPGADGSASDPEPGPPLPAPAAGHWRFEVHYGDYADGHQVASLDYSISLEGQRYRLRSEGRAEGLTALLYSGVLSQSSSGRLGVAGLEPERYAEQRGRRPERWVSVDRAAARIAFSGGESQPLVAGVQDRLSVLVQIGLIARATPDRVAVGRVLEVPELSLRSVERARYESRGEATLQTDRGPIRALHLERVAPRRAEDPRIELWLGYDRGMLPVRIRLTDPGGRVLDQISPP
ncbi:MAG: hypothetical protein RIS35_228 [Pseudomonadota bacterium]